MESLIVAVAQYLLLAIFLAAAVIWLFLPRQDKVGLAIQGMVALVVAIVLIRLVAASYVDPRPFVVNPLVKPLFAHPADNGFPSDHTAMGVTVALLVMMYRRWLGVALLAASLLVGAARVAAQVHHIQDIAAGAMIAVVAVGTAAAIWGWARLRLPRRLAWIAAA